MTHLYLGSFGEGGVAKRCVLIYSTVHLLLLMDREHCLVRGLRLLGDVKVLLPLGEILKLVEVCVNDGVLLALRGVV